MSADLWKPKRKRDKHRSRRKRCECFGELVQGDGSHHDWLEGRGPRTDLLVKELRLAGATTIEQANEVLKKIFLPWFNRCCTVKPASRNDAHRLIQPSMNLSAILSIQEKRKVANDYTIRLDNQMYQLLSPAWPGLRCGWVTVESRPDGSLHIRFRGHYLKYKALGLAKSPGALPPNPRSLSHSRTPAEAQRQGCAIDAAQPSAVRPANGRSGRTPAEPYPPEGEKEHTVRESYRPGPNHPWRKFRIRRIIKHEDILTLAK